MKPKSSLMASKKLYLSEILFLSLYFSIFYCLLLYRVKESLKIWCDFFAWKRSNFLKSKIKFYLILIPNYNLESFCSMFPNDDICNVKAAKSAARRIFEKYGMTASQQTQSKGLGQ
jgi:hypothetical protein